MIKHSLFIIIIILFVFQGNIKAQESESYVKIHHSESISRLLTKHIQTNEYHPYINGYRIQLYSISGVNSRDKANRFKAEFLIRNPKTVVYIVYQAPYYKVRIGDFKTKINALSFLQTISKKYPSGFIVNDQIRFTETTEEESEETAVE
ncbi:MAG: SPOR domain-containing protein [Bacteroidales bacterium]|nr:SPOR domain-containing protein [Bacteroidales bacterium]